MQLKNDRAAVRLTVMELESVHIDSLSNEKTPSLDNQKLDLENAVLMQELTALKVGICHFCTKHKYRKVVSVGIAIFSE